MKCFFPLENSHFGRPKTNFRRFQKWKAKKKKKKKKGPHLFSDVFLLPFPNFHLFFSIFTPFLFFPCLFFPNTSAKISRSEVSGGTLPPCPPPPACYATDHMTLIIEKSVGVATIPLKLCYKKHVGQIRVEILVRNRSRLLMLICNIFDKYETFNWPSTPHSTYNFWKRNLVYHGRGIYSFWRDFFLAYRGSNKPSNVLNLMD